MKKLILALVVLVAISGAVSALDLLQYPPPVEGGDLMVDIGLGLGGAGSGKMLIPPIFGVVEYALPVKVPISVGGMVAFWMNRWEAWYGYSDGRYTNIAIDARGNWHWAFPVDWLDFYTGLSLGYRIEIWKAEWMFDESGTDGYFDWGIQAGAHFYFKKNIGVMAEVGYPFFLKVGAALKF